MEVAIVFFPHYPSETQLTIDGSQNTMGTSVFGCGILPLWFPLGFGSHGKFS